MRKLLLGLTAVLIMVLATNGPLSAQTSESASDSSTAESNESSQANDSSQADDSSSQTTSADQHDDADQTVRSSLESPSHSNTSSPPAAPSASSSRLGSRQNQAQSSQARQNQSRPNQYPLNQAQPNQALPYQSQSNQALPPAPQGARPNEQAQQSILSQPNQQPAAQHQSGEQPLDQPLGQRSFDQQQLDQQQANQLQSNQQNLSSQQLDLQQQDQQASSQQLSRQAIEQDLGIEFQQSSQVAGRGLTINSIQPGSVFFDSGLRQGDVLVSLDNRPILNQSQFVEFIRTYPEPRIPVIVMRGGRQETIFINRPAHWEVALQPSSVQPSQAILGVILDSNITNAAVIRSVTPGGPADLAGLRSGDQITALNGQMVSSPHQVTQMIASMLPGQQVVIDYSRQQMDVRTQAVLVPRNGGPVEHSVGYPPEPARQVIAPAPVETRYYRSENRPRYYYDNDFQRRRFYRRYRNR